MKTTAMEHQVTGLELLKQNPKAYMLACEQGTGKTWMLMADGEYQFENKKIEAMFIVAPKGVHTNWILREIPTHMSVPVRSAYFSSGASRKIKNQIERLFRPANGELIILAMNIDAIIHKEGFALAQRFLHHWGSISIVDESHRIKSPKASCTKKMIKLAPLAVSRRTASGTPVTNSPSDLFTQFEYLSPFKPLLGTGSYRAFHAEYTELIPEENYVMQSIIKKAAAKAFAQNRKVQEWDIPQLAKKDDRGRPICKNLDKLNEILKPYMYRVLKKECLDLPDKIYRTVYYDLSQKQRAVYDFADEELRFETGEQVDIFTPLVKQTKLQQIASGFIMREGVVTKITESTLYEDETDAELIPAEDNPRMELLRNVIEDIEENTSVIIWARFRQEIAQIADMLRDMGATFVEYHGGVKKADREAAVDLFQSGAARFFLGNPQSGGTGLTLTKAEEMIYYSQSYNLGIRLQSEDRAHRIGTVKNVVYTDFAAIDTIDEKISIALQDKAEMAANILDRGKS